MVRRDSTQEGTQQLQFPQGMEEQRGSSLRAPPGASLGHQLPRNRAGKTEGSGWLLFQDCKETRKNGKNQHEVGFPAPVAHSVLAVQ